MPYATSQTARIDRLGNVSRQIRPTCLFAVFGNKTDVSPTGFNTRHCRLARVAPPWTTRPSCLSNVARGPHQRISTRCRVPSMVDNSAYRPSPMRTSGCHQAFSRVGLVALAMSRDVLYDALAIRILRWGGSDWRGSSPRLKRSPVGPAVVDHAAKQSLLCRSRFSGASGRTCGLVLAAAASDHSAKLPWAQ